jgi:hypothetical protein
VSSALPADVMWCCAAATGAGAAQFRGKLQQVMFTAGFRATGVQTGDILDALRLTSSDGADSTIVAAQAALAAVSISCCFPVQNPQHADHCTCKSGLGCMQAIVLLLLCRALLWTA